MEVSEHNRIAWNRESRGGSDWAKPVPAHVIERARQGSWEVILTPARPVPRAWFGNIKSKRVLCLASGGGQQAPVLAAGGGRVVSFDISEEQLAKDRMVARRDGLDLQCVQGTMTDLSVFGDEAFDLIFNPVSTVFVPDPRPVWRESHRVLRPGGALLAGFMNPAFFLFDHDKARETGKLVARYPLPYAETDLEDIPPARRRAIEKGSAREFSHSLEALIGGQLAAGFFISGFYEDWWDDDATPLNRLCPTSMATLAHRQPGRENDMG